ncbi:P47 [Urbanus proteus nucleopolyhedrovirus]|uniref:P47 n=1 Tax=Urbanus proteus nucleopolyhedrovirus TaxID=1675866 RepID=A0A162GUG7_9ABAC|nr:P47 [Urbanus proteus nucleopolyhedrovirus]AKR17340.1 P47 [Urbanus proteus nucleopolyhedrovirus]
MAFVRYYSIETQMFPQCCKYLAKQIILYNTYVQCKNFYQKPTHVANLKVIVNDDGFVKFTANVAVFEPKNLKRSTPDDLDVYIDCTRAMQKLSEHQMCILKLIVRDRWYKGDFKRLSKILQQNDVTDLITFGCNVMWERGYEDNYTLGQQLSIRITTKLIQSGLDFKHQNDIKSVAPLMSFDEHTSNCDHSWNNNGFETLINSLKSLSDIIKRHKHTKKYIAVETVNADIFECFKQEKFTIFEHKTIKNLCVIVVDDDKNSLLYLNKMRMLLEQSYVNVLFVTDVEYYMQLNSYAFYLYNSLKFYYYCLTGKFVFEDVDYELIFLLNLIISLEWFNKGHLNSFILEKSNLYNPLELSTRRMNSIKRAALESRQISNDHEIKMDFIKGKRMKMGSHYGKRIVCID